MKTNLLNLGAFLILTMGLTSCNSKDEYFAKTLIEAPVTVDGPEGNESSGQDGSEGFGVVGGVDSGDAGDGSNGSSTNGSATGGSVGGSAAGGSSAGGSVGGSATGGSSAGGSVGGSATGGSSAGGSVGGSSAGGSVGGSVTGGSSAGGSVGGSATGGSSAGGSVGGSTTGGSQFEKVTEVFQQAAEQTKQLDILWVIDNSYSMHDEQASLGSNFSAFIDDFILKNVNFKMAITTTDTSTPQLKGAIVPTSNTKLTSEKAQANPEVFKADFKRLVQVGTKGNKYEKGLEATEGFLQKYGSALRSEAYLAVVIISDEPDQSSKTVNQYVDYLKSFKKSEGLVKMYTVVNTMNANALRRYAEASKLTAGSVAEIKNDFHTILSDMGESLINLLDSFALGNEPVDGSLKVYVNGALATNYTYDAATRSLKFYENSLPPVGAEIKVTYLK